MVIAVVNFVNLLTARSARRAREVSVRKLAGAGRRVLLLQFLAESIVYVIAAALVAVALTELLLPYVNAFLTAGATFRYWQDPTLIGAILLVTLLLGALAGASAVAGLLRILSLTESNEPIPPNRDRSACAGASFTRSLSCGTRISHSPQMGWGMPSLPQEWPHPLCLD